MPCAPVFLCLKYGAGLYVICRAVAGLVQCYMATALSEQGLRFSGGHTPANSSTSCSLARLIGLPSTALSGACCFRLS
jgi:hypothetical protein